MRASCRIKSLPSALALLAGLSIAAGGLAQMREPPATDLSVHVQVQGSPPRFEPARIRVRPGQTVSVTIENHDTRGAHDWVLVQRGKVSQVRAYGATAGENPGGINYSPDILARTRSAAPGATATISFEAPDHPGEYPFISTVPQSPGGSPPLRGVLVVQALR